MFLANGGLSIDDDLIDSLKPQKKQYNNRHILKIEVRTRTIGKAGVKTQLFIEPYSINFFIDDFALTDE